ncbi:hypothetical protein [Gluconobacter morbifer]|uniref:hypothetical protein n=1 Tax=Gluconobacter morbifer TaxID=479935 RepID=UPI000A02D74F|nr:hypothetical protein [Gluconobacter morbifer]
MPPRSTRHPAPSRRPAQADHAPRYRRRPETLDEIRAENVDFWVRAAHRYERIARNSRIPGIRVWAAREADHAHGVAQTRRDEQLHEVS